MPADAFEQMRRNELAAIVEWYTSDGMITEVDERESIKKQAMAQFEKQLDAKLKNAQLENGEGIAIVFNIDIIGTNGKVRGGSGSARNMPEYIEWRNAVYERDNYTCQECGATGALNAHHIKSWAKHPKLRFDVDNGKTLCVECHKAKHPHLKII